MAIWYIIGCLAVLRMTTDIASARQLEGPFGLYDILREHVSMRSYPTWIKEGVDCPWCVSFWFGSAFALAYPLAGLCSWWLYPVLAAGLSGPASLLYSMIEMFGEDMASDV